MSQSKINKKRKEKEYLKKNQGFDNVVMCFCNFYVYIVFITFNFSLVYYYYYFFFLHEVNVAQVKQVNIYIYIYIYYNNFQLMFILYQVRKVGFFYCFSFS